MNAYEVTEPELKTIGLLNAFTMGCFGLGGSILGFCLNFKKDLLMVEKVPPEARALEFAVDWLGFGAAAFFFVCAVVGLIARGSIVRKIKKDSRVIG